MKKLITLLLIAVATSVLHGVEARPPNIVFIMADDLGWRDLGVYGSKLYQTPNIDRLAESGMRFTDAYAASPLCSPTRAGVLTGLHPHRTGFTAPAGHLANVIVEQGMAPTAQPWARGQNSISATRLDTRFTTYAEQLRDASYRTLNFGKWHLGNSPYMPKYHGFEIDIPSWNVPGPGNGYVYPWNIPGYPEFPGEAGEQLEEKMGEVIADYIDKFKDEPFLINYWMFTPHSPYDARPELVEKYQHLIDSEDPQKSAIMAGMLESMDRAVGTVLNALERAGVADNTIVIFTSDNGGSAFGEAEPGVLPTSNHPLKAGKGTIFEGGIRVPLIIRWPGVAQPGSVSDAFVQTTDLFATFHQMASVPLPVEYPGDGVDISPVLRGDTDSVRETVFTYFPHNVDATGNLSAAALRRGDYKVIRYFADGPDGTDRVCLYNLAEDIGENNDLSNELPALTKELNQLLGKEIKATGALLPGQNPAYDPAANVPAPITELHGERTKYAETLSLKNGSFEKPELSAEDPEFYPGHSTFRSRAYQSDWALGHYSGIARTGSTQIGDIVPVEGNQVAYIQGDPEKTQSPERVRHIIGAEIRGLKVGQSYVIEWSEAAIGEDGESTALTVILSPSPGYEGAPIFLQRRVPVANDGKWQNKQKSFTATAERMRLNFHHFVPNQNQADSDGPTTLIDAVSIRAE